MITFTEKRVFQIQSRSVGRRRVCRCGRSQKRDVQLHRRDYYRIRQHSSLGYLSPEKDERKYVEERDKRLGEILDQKKVKEIKVKYIGI